MLLGKEVGYVRRTGDGKKLVMMFMITIMRMRMRMMLSRWRKRG